MSGIFIKARALTLGTFHDLLDKAIDLNSPTVIRQYVRDLETSIQQLSNEAAVQAGQLRTLNRQKADLETKIATDSATVKQLLASTNPNAAQIARDKAQVILTEQAQLATFATDITTQEKAVSDINTAVQRLNAKHDQMVARVHELERLDLDTKAKNHAAAAIQNAGSVLATANNAGVDDLAEHMRRKNDEASAKFDQAMGGLASEPETNSADVDALLASLSAK